MNEEENLACACCGYDTVEERGNYEICPICFWEDDPVQFAHPHLGGGANKMSLRQGQKNYIDFGACDIEMLKHTRKPTADDHKSQDWKPLDD